MKDISDKTRAHLTRVYTTLLTTTGTCALGMYLISNRNNSENTQIGWLFCLAFAMGFMVGPGINQFAEVKPELLTQAVVYTGGAFGSFSAVSLFSQRRSFLFLGGIIATMLQAMLMYRLVGWLMGGAAFGLGYVMCGLFMVCLWIIFDT